MHFNNHLSQKLETMKTFMPRRPGEILARLLLAGLLILLPRAGLAAAPVLQANQLLWVSNPATNGTVVGVLGLTSTDGLTPPLSFNVLSCLPFSCLTAETVSNYYGQVKVVNSNMLALSNVFSLQVAATNISGGSTASVMVLAPTSFQVAEMSSNGVSIGRIVPTALTNRFRFFVDVDATADPQVTNSFSITPDGEIRVANGDSLDFETRSNYFISLVITNFFNTNLVSGQILIRLTNVNEAPIFSDQGFTLPTNSLETVIGTLKAQDPEGDALDFRILGLQVGGAVADNGYFTILNHTNLCLKGTDLSPPASSILTVLVSEIRTDGQPALTNIATVTVEAPKTYSRFGIPLLLPLAGHDGPATTGLPVQAVAAGTGTNQDVYLAGLDNNRQPYIEIYLGGLYRDPLRKPLETNFVPTVIAADSTNVYIGGTKTDRHQAAVYRYSTKGVALMTNYLSSCLNVMSLVIDQGMLYLCGGAGANPASMVPYWTSLDTNLTLVSGSPHLITQVNANVPYGPTGPVTWGVATAIARDTASQKIFLGGYWNFNWTWYYYSSGWNRFWGIRSWATTPGHYSFLALDSNPLSGVRTPFWTQAAYDASGNVITDIKIGHPEGSTAIYTVEENAAYGVRSVQVKEYDAGLNQVSGRLLSISGAGDVRAQSLTLAGSEGSESLYLAGVIPGAKQTVFSSGGIEAKLFPGGNRFFLLKLDMDLKFSTGWQSPLLLSQFDYVPTGGLPIQPLSAAVPPLFDPKLPLATVVPYDAKGGVLLAGNIASGRLTLSQDRNENSLVAQAGHNAGFVTIVKTNKAFEVPNFLEVDSDFGISGVHVKPFSGKQMAVLGETYTVEVVSPIYLRADGSYINSFTNEVTEQQIRDEAVTRYTCTGYTVEDTDIIGSSSSYTFTLDQNTKITFHWVVEHALTVRSELSGTGAIPIGGGYQRDTVNSLGLTSLAAGNPTPEVKKHWIKQDELVVPTIDGTALDLTEYNTRYFVTGYAASGWAIGTNLNNSFAITNAFQAIEPRQQIPQFPMRGPATITYLWGIQHRVQVSTTTLDSQDWPGIKVVDDPTQPNRTGVGEFWFRRGAHLIVGGQDIGNSLQGALLATGDLTGRTINRAFLYDPTNAFEIVVAGLTNHYVGAHINRLLHGSTVSWEYGDQRYLQTVQIGNPVDVLSAVGPNNLLKLNTNAAPVIQVLESPPGSAVEDMCEWDAVAARSFPLRPGRVLLHYQGRSQTNIVMTLEITSEFPVTPHYRQLAHPEMSPIHLDTDPGDNLAFLKLAFSTNATVNGSDFTASGRDLSVLLFSRTDSNAIPYQPATGNRSKETLYVRVVATTPWDEQPGGVNLTNPPASTLAYIGTKLTSSHDTAGIGTGFVVYTNAPYNAFIYDRTKTADAGPIIPVNRQFRTQDLTRDLLVIWYERRDAILWPYTTERFDPQWPMALNPASLPDPLPDLETMAVNATAYLRRIVVASRLGSEGKDHALRNQLSFAPPRYDQVAIYNQPLTNRPGYNPNEEHALIAPSFKFLDQPNPPSVAYALRNDLNRTNQVEGSYSSDPYVLVQYFDHGTNGEAGEYKMAVYAVELEDDRSQLNPDRYTSTISGQEREFPYLFHYSMKAGEPVQAPYPLGLVIGLTPCTETRGANLTAQRVYWEDYKGQPWAVSAGDFRSWFYYPLPIDFWVPNPATNPPGISFEYKTSGKVVLSGAIPNPIFAARSSFTLNGQSIGFIGSAPEAFVAAVNRAQSSVRAAILNSGEIQLTAVVTNLLDLVDGTNAPLKMAGFLNVANRANIQQISATHITVSPTPAVLFTATWPDTVPILKAGETLTFAGGEYKTDYPTTDGLPGVVGWAAGEIIFDSLNPLADVKAAFTNYAARLISPLEERYIEITSANAQKIVPLIQPSTGVTQAKGTRWQFLDVPASLSRRISYDPLNRRLCLKGFLNDKTLGDPTLTASPPPVYVLEPNILTPSERDALSGFGPLSEVQEWKDAVARLYAVSRNPNGLRLADGSDADAAAFYAGLEEAVTQANNQDAHDTNGNPILLPNSARHQKTLGPGLALIPSPAVLDPNSGFTNGYVTLVENNNPDVGGPITLYIVKVDKQYHYRGAIKTILSDNVFDEKVTLRHSGDFGANADDIVYQWFYREEDGTEAPVPPASPWKIFPDQSANLVRGSGMYQINLEGTGGLLLADNLFFVRYRHRNDTPPVGPNSTDWVGTEWDSYGRFETNSGQITKVGSQWAGAANSPTVDGEYKPQLVMGWIKRVLDRVNPYEARISDFRTESAPSTYTSMLQELGPRYEGPVALNPDKNVIENVGLIQLYETILNRGMDLSINLSSPITTPGINTALLLAATRLSDFYMLLGNEAYNDAQDPTIAYGDDSMDFATDYGNYASSMFSFENEVGSLLEEELGLLRGVSESYGRPVYNRLFWNFTKSLGEVAYAVNYDVTDFNRDGFINESDAMALYPQGHGDAWGHYLTALKSHYRLLQHPYYNWVSRTEQYNLLDVVINVDYLDERRFAEAAAARAKTGAEILNLTYRSRYVEDPDGQWQGYTDTDTDRAWGVDGWARRAGQGALFDWITANALLPSADTNLEHNALNKIDRSTVTAIQTLASELGEIQSQYDSANNGLNPLGLSQDIVPFDIDATFNAVGSTSLSGPTAIQGVGHFSQIYQRALTALANARTVFFNACYMQSRQRQVKESADSFRQQVVEQDLDFRNRLIEIFGTPYEGQIGTGKAYPAGYYGPDLMLWMYVAVNDLNSATVPTPATNTTQWIQGFATQVRSHPYVIDNSSGNTSDDFETDMSTWFAADIQTVTNVGVDSLDLENNRFLVISNLPITASGYTFQAPSSWGRRASPGELQLTLCELVQAEAELTKSVADYSVLVRKIDDIADLIEAKHGVAARDLWIRKAQEATFVTFNAVKIALHAASAGTQIGAKLSDDLFEASAEAFPKMTPIVGMAVSPGDIFSAARLALKSTEAASGDTLEAIAAGLDKAAEILDDTRGIIEIVDARKMEEANQSYELRQKIKELAQALRDELPLRVEAFKRVEALRQVSDRYRKTLEGGRRLLDQRQVFNIRTAGVTQRLRYQDMAFRVFRNDAVQKYRATYDLAARYTYMAAKAFDYETNLSPDDRGSAIPLLTEIVRTRILGTVQDGEPVQGIGLAGILATLRDNWNVLCGRMSFNNAQYEQELISLRSELFRISPGATNDALWRQTLKRYRVDDLWQVPEFRRYCRPPAARSAGALPGLVIPFGTEIKLGRNVFGWPLGPGDHAYDPSVFATKVQSAAIYFTNYQTAYLAATPRVYLVPAGMDVMTIPTSAELATRKWTIVDQAIPVPFQTGTNDLADPYWIPSYNGLAEPFGQIRRFSSFLAKDVTAFEPGADALSYDTRLIGRSVWNTRWLLIIPGGHLLADGSAGLDTFIDGAQVPGNPTARDGNGIKDIQLLFNTYGYSGN